MDSDARPVYSIGAVARMLSIAPATLRSWEDRYGLVVPQRSPGGHRLYSRQQVDALRFVKEELARGAHASDAHRLLAERLGTPADDVADLRPPSATPESVVLLAERDPHSAELAEFFLSARGYEVARVASAEDAFTYLAVARPALVVVELMISGGIGADVCRAFKGKGIPVVAVSVLEGREQALGAGADAFLTKPLVPNVLVSTVDDLVESNPRHPSSPTRPTP